MKPDEYQKPILPITDKVSHQLLFFDPQHPLARQNGMVVLGRHALSVKLGRWLERTEMARYLDGNPQNVNPDNLELTTRASLAHEVHGKRVVELVCPYCGQTFKVSPSHKDRRIYHSEACRRLAERQFVIDPEELRRLVWEMPSKQIGLLYGVSDKTVEKRCRALGISKPPRGYWAKQKASSLQRENKA